MQTTLEAIMFVGYEIFKYKSPKTSVNTTLSFFPSLTGSERYRVQYDLSVRQELVTDFFFDLTFYYTFDSHPPPDAASGTDYGLVTSLGWAF
jgi:hypothetical protein